MGGNQFDSQGNQIGRAVGADPNEMTPQGHSAPQPAKAANFLGSSGPAATRKLPDRLRIGCKWIQNGKSGLYSEEEQKAILTGATRARAVKGTCLEVSASAFWGDQELTGADIDALGLKEQIVFVMSLDGEISTSGADGKAAEESHGFDLRINPGERMSDYAGKTLQVSAEFRTPGSDAAWLKSENKPVTITFDNVGRG